MSYYVILMLTYAILGLLELEGSLQIVRRKIYAFFLMLPMACLVGLRAENIGSDTINYVRAYEFIETYPSYELFLIDMGRMEPGYTHLSYFLSYYGFSYFQFQIVVAFFIFYSFWRFIVKYSPNISASCFIISIGTLYASMNVMRMELAVAILLFAIPYIQKRQWIRFLIVVFIAFLFHKSSMVFLIMYPLCVLKYNRKITTLIILSSVAIAFMGVTFFKFLTSELEMYESYTEGKYFSEDRSLVGVSIICLETFLTLLMFKWTGYFDEEQYVKLNDDKKDNVSFEYISRMAYWMVFALSIIGFSNNMMNRISGYFSIVTMIMIPCAILCVKSKDTQRLLYLLIVTIFITERITIWILRPNWNLVVPYEFGF